MNTANDHPAGPLAWMDRGMCVAAGPARWDAMTLQDQQIVCHGCPVREPCARYLRHRPALHREPRRPVHLTHPPTPHA